MSELGNTAIQNIIYGKSRPEIVWQRKNISRPAELNQITEMVSEVKPELCAIDTETTGLNIKHDTPFLFQFGFIKCDKRKKELVPTHGFTYTIDLEDHEQLGHITINEFINRMAPQCGMCLGHNMSYDIHMLENLGIDITWLLNNSWDTQAFIRAAHDAIQIEKGGAPLGLKKYAQKYITENAKDHEKLLKAEQKTTASRYNKILRNAFKKINTPDIYKTVSETGFIPDNIEDIRARRLYNNWYVKLPKNIKKSVRNTGICASAEIPYNILNRKNVVMYGHLDIQLTLLLALKTLPIIQTRKTEHIIETEKALLPVIYNMESAGLPLDNQGLVDVRAAMIEELKTTNERLKTTFNVTANQNMKVLDKLNSYLPDDLKTHTTGKVALMPYLTQYPDNAKELLELVWHNRTLVKWYKTYLMKMIKAGDKIYPQMNSVGTISGRSSSDLQQIPKAPLKALGGSVLYEPRKHITTDPDNGFSKLVSIDLSQIELRIQAVYTVLCGNPDLNMLRAYVPCQCHDANGYQYDLLKDRDLWNSRPWFKNENNEPWTPSDLHTITTINAGVDPNDPDFEIKRRDIGKKVNFSKQYGAGIGKLKEFFPTATQVELKRIDGAYYNSYPGIKTYHNYCMERARAYAYTENLFGRKYYNATGHHLSNLLIQGSAADLFKKNLVLVYNYMQEHNLKSKLVLQVHDELIWLWHDSDSLRHAVQLKRLMEKWDDCFMPVVANISISTTNWAGVKEVV